MPDTAWPIRGHPPDSSRDLVDTPVSMSPVSVSTRQQRFARARLPDPHLTRHPRLFHIAHHGRVAAPAACGGLKPPPAGRLRRADNPSSPAQHRFTKLYLHRTPFHVRDTPTSRCPNSSPPSSDTPTPAPNASVPPPRVQDGSSPKFHATRDTLSTLVSLCCFNNHPGLLED